MAPPVLEYVAWIDIMGTASSLERSLEMTAGFVFRLHIASIRSAVSAVSVHPVMDGLYALSQSQQDMLRFLEGVFTCCAEDFIHTSEPEHRFVIRAALAYGPMMRGENLPAAASQPQGDAPNPLGASIAYREQILIGLPMVQAHSSEGKAPPFGVYVHESARSFSPPVPIQSVLPGGSGAIRETRTGRNLPPR